jgi:hypothetical protein
MHNRPIAPWPFLITLLIFSCHQAATDKAPAGDSTDKKAPPPEALHNPEFRDQPKKDPAVIYKEEIKDDHLNHWSFSVNLYETSRTMDYRVKMQFEELPGDDTIHLPDLGTPPRPVLKKGDDKYTCIIGFLDNDNQFREYKLVYARNDQLGIKTLKHYSVTQGYKLVSQ